MNSIDDDQEKRKYPRLFMELPVEYRVIDTPYAHGGLVINLSKRGLLIQSLKNFSVGTNLNIVVLFPKKFELADFEVLAEVVWKETYWREEWEGYQYGLKFIQIGDEDNRKLEHLLSGWYELEEISQSG